MLVLLDIDGVMVKAASWRPLEILEDGFPAFSEQATKALIKILYETKGSIVLTTSHKHNYTLKEWHTMFRFRGIDAQIDRLEDNISNLSRRDEVLNWLDKSDSEDFVIIDDDKSLNDLPSTLKEKLVLTSSMIGLTNNDVSKAIAILNGSESIYT